MNGDFEGNSADYMVNIHYADGYPSFQDTPQQDGYIVMCLPEGKYTFEPSVYLVNNGGTTYNVLPSFTNYVGACSIIDGTLCLQIALTNLIDCPTNRTFHVAGSVSSCTNVTNISYVLNGVTTSLCNNCGVNPPFAFDILLADCENQLSVIARDVNGDTASVTRSLHFDITPPVLSGCTNVSTNSLAGTNGNFVSYAVTALDNCDGPLPVTCDPPSGSFFHDGITTVICSAVDHCGNIGTCNFNITVTNPCPELVVNGSFETTSPAVAPNAARFNLDPTTGVPGWTTTAGDFLEVWRNTFAGIPASEGINHLEINAQSDNQRVSQVVTGLSTNCPAAFCFDYTGRFGLVSNTYNNDFTVTLGGGVSFSVTLDPAPFTNGGWRRFCTNFIPSSSAVTIAFQGHPHFSDGTDATEGGAHIDNVSLTQCCPTNPPGTNCPDLWVKLTAIYPGPKLHHIRGSTTPCCGTNFSYYINYGNRGSAPVTGATIAFSYPVECSIVSITQPSSCSAIPSPFIPNTTGSCGPLFFPSPGLETFALPILNPGDDCNIEVEVHLCCDPLAACGHQPRLLGQVTILPLANDCRPANNHWAHPTRPCCSYDPNDCTVSPKGCGPEGFIHRDQALTYLIQFQNEGGGAARDVGVQNVLDSELDLSTLEILGSSHEFVLERNGRELLWIFHDIELPSQTVNEKASHGFVEFRIHPLPHAPVGTVITNSAAVYFDANEPVVTITTTNTVTEDPVPIAAFTVVPRPDSAGYTNDFHYTGGTLGAQCEWYFGPDAIPQSSTDLNPSGVVFTGSGPHLVELETRLGDCNAEPAVQLLTAGRPRLSIARTDTAVSLTWSGEGFVVQETDSVAPPAPWHAVQAPAISAGGRYVVNLPVSAGTRFYKLTDAP